MLKDDTRLADSLDSQIGEQNVSAKNFQISADELEQREHKAFMNRVKKREEAQQIEMQDGKAQVSAK